MGSRYHEHQRTKYDQRMLTPAYFRLCWQCGMNVWPIQISIPTWCRFQELFLNQPLVQLKNDSLLFWKWLNFTKMKHHLIVVLINLFENTTTPRN
jgi:hypothetical protein